MLRIATALMLVCLPTATLAQDPSPRARLQAGLGGAAALEAAPRFDYRLTVRDGDGHVVRDGHYALLPTARRVHVRDALASAEVWSGEDGSWRLDGTQWAFLSPAAAAPYRQHVAYHFLPLLLDPRTQFDAVARDRLRLVPEGAEPFEVQVDADGRILENRFDGGTVARELDYRRVGSLWWPMAFEVVEAGQVVRRGAFTEASLPDQAALPPMTASGAPPALPQARPDAALLVGAGWLSGARNDYNLGMDADARLLVFGRSEAEFRQAQIWMARREGAHWTAPQPVPFSDPRYSDSDPWLTPDGRTLYFVSNRPTRGEAPRSDLDVWRVAVHANGFGTPEHLAALSSEGQELGPELHDGWLYFNSSRKGGPAGLAIYRARATGDAFDAPQPLGAPFNDGRAQGDFTLSPDGRLALFWSIRDGNPDGDLFAARREGDGWSRAVRLPGPVNAEGFDFTPSFSDGGKTLYFASMRKPAWLDDAAHVFNGQSNVYVVPAATVEAALVADGP